MVEKKYKDYLNKTFLEELNYKIWITKSSRFQANKRLLLIAKLSSLCNSVLSVYLIALGLLSVYNINTQKGFDSNVLAYTITILSILLLVFSQLEGAKNFQLQAKDFHNCGLELSELYNRLRVFKTMGTPSDNDKKEFAVQISKEYQSILSKYENHDPIDFEIAKTLTYKYHELTLLNVVWIKAKYYFQTQSMYHLLIIIPPIVFISLFLK